MNNLHRESEPPLEAGAGNELQRPAECGYRWPAEWEPHEATWLSWPHNPDTWPGKFEPVPDAYAALVRAIADFEPVHVLASSQVLPLARQRLASSEERCRHPVHFHEIATNDAWIRDHGPIFLASPEQPPALVDWQYNAWGGKYPPFDLDNAVPGNVARLLNYRRFTPGMVLEGGAIEGNGQGTVLTTRSCLLHPGRNPTMDEGIVEQYLREYLGAQHVIWLSGDGIVGDDTDGHIDQLARFVNPRTIVAGHEANTEDENWAPLQKLWQELAQIRDIHGQAFELVPLPTPQPHFFQQHRLPASYCNFYLVNGGVVVPQFDDPADSEACRVLERLMPDRQIVPVPMLDLVWGLGAVHCLTQQQCRAFTPIPPFPTSTD